MQLFDPLSRIKSMGRRPRTHFSGAVYHAMARGVNRCAIYLDDQDRRAFLETLTRICVETSCHLIAYCLMGNHFHLAAQVGRIPLSSIMHRLMTTHAKHINRRHGRTGHLFQSRYDANLCLNDRYLATLIPYIHMNPVRAGLVARPQDWPWSSYAGEEINPADLLNFDPWPNASRERIDLTRRNEEQMIGLPVLAANISRGAGIRLDDLRSESRLSKFVEARRLLARDAIREGHSQAAIARWLCTNPSSISRYVRETYATTQCQAPAQRLSA